MRLLSHLSDSLSNSLRIISALTLLCVFAFGGMMTYQTTVAAPKVAKDFAARAEKAAAQASERRREAERAQALAEEGWGYDSGAAFDDRPAPRTREDVAGGWGD